MKLSQTAWVADHLLRYGSIRRNYCIERRITRLASRINDLKNAKWKIASAKLKTKNGTDHQYTLISSPVCHLKKTLS